MAQRLKELTPYFRRDCKSCIRTTRRPFVKISITEVVKTLFEGILLVFLVMYLFLQNFARR